MSNLFPHSPGRLHGLDHLRALAIVMVMIFHFGPGTPAWLEPVALIGWTGVDLFFVLSGYLIGYQLLSEFKETNNISCKRFYIKRFFRIIPAYLTVLMVYYALPNLRGGRGMPPLWKFLTFTQNLGLDIATENTFSHAWSLCIEEQFYLLLPVTLLTIGLLGFQKSAPYLITGLVLLGIALRFYSWSEYVLPFINSNNDTAMAYGFFEKIYHPSYTRMDGLLVGVGIASVATFNPKLLDRAKKYGNLTLLFGISLFAIAYKLCEDLISFNTIIYGLLLISLAYGVILIAAMSPGCFLHKIRSRLTLVIATLSYSLYLTHKLIFNLTKHWVQGLESAILNDWIFPICFITATCAAFVLYLFIERPFLRIRKAVLEINSLIPAVARKRIR